MSKKSKSTTVEITLARFNENYEDAVHGVFYDGGEGGYQYAPGFAPCNPLDVLKEWFPDADLEVLEEANNTLQSSGSAWVRKERY
jgi:hypothetical protein